MDPNICKCHLLGNVLHFLRVTPSNLFWYTGNAAANYSQCLTRPVFPDRPAYDEFYEIMLRVVDIAHMEFATNVQDLVIVYLRGVDEGTAVWFKEHWSGLGG